MAIDGSNHSFRAADISKAKAEIMHSHTKEELEFNRRQKFLRFEELLKGNNVNYDFKIFHGDPAQVIIDYANEDDFELLVLGSKGKGLLCKYAFKIKKAWPYHKIITLW